MEIKLLKCVTELDIKQHRPVIYLSQPGNNPQVSLPSANSENNLIISLGKIKNIKNIQRIFSH